MADPWSKKHLRKVDTGVLVRSANRLRHAFRDLVGTPAGASLQRQLQAVRDELARRGLHEAPSGGDGAPRWTQGAPPAQEPSRPAPQPPPEQSPMFRLIPQLRGTSSKVVSVLAAEGVVRYQSEPVKWLLGFEAERFENRGLEDFLQPPSRPLLREALARMEAREEKFDDWRFQFRTASGGALWLEGMASNFLHDPRLGGVLVYWREAT